MTLQNDDLFLFAVSSCGSHLSSFFTFLICFKCQTTIEWSALSSSATSHVVIRGSDLMISLNWWLSPSYGRPLCSSSSRLSSPLQNFLNNHCTFVVRSSRSKCLVDVASCLPASLQPILNLNKKKNRSNLHFV